jgi:hypothetical protein
MPTEPLQLGPLLGGLGCTIQLVVRIEGMWVNSIDMLKELL